MGMIFTATQAVQGHIEVTGSTSPSGENFHKNLQMCKAWDSVYKYTGASGEIAPTVVVIEMLPVKPSIP